MMRMRAVPAIAVLYLISSRSSGGSSVGSSPATAHVPPPTPSTTATPAPTVTAEPQTLAAATKLAKEETARWAADDIAGAWELWTAAGQDAISQGDYVRLIRGCHPDGPIPIKVSNVRLATASPAVARIGLGMIQGAYDIVYEDSQWRWQPTQDDRADYKLGWKRALAKIEAEEACD